MKYSFITDLLEDGNRLFIEIPFNVWEVCEKKGMIAVEVEIQKVKFECKLVPKGNGRYYIPIKKVLIDKIDCSKELKVRFKLVDGLSRITTNSPYSVNNPIRKINCIRYQQQPSSGLCGQTCIAMLADIPIHEVIKIMKSNKWQASVSKMIETLDYFGLSYRDTVYTGRKAVTLPECCIINVKPNHMSHFVVYYKDKYYDPGNEKIQDINFEDVISYLEIII